MATEPIPVFRMHDFKMPEWVKKEVTYVESRFSDAELKSRAKFGKEVTFPRQIEMGMHVRARGGKGSKRPEEGNLNDRILEAAAKLEAIKKGQY